MDSPTSSSPNLLLLPLILLTTAFGPGLNSIPVLTFFQPLPLLQFYTDIAQVACPKRYSAYLAAGMLHYTAGNTIAYAGMFNDPSFSFLNVVTIFIISLFYSLLLTPSYAFSTSNQAKALFNPAVVSLLYPLTFTSSLFVISLTSPIGSWTNPAYGYVSDQTVLQLFSVAGIHGVVFLTSYAQVYVSDAISSLRSSGAVTLRATLPKTLPLTVPFIILLLSASLSSFTSTVFFQKSIDDTAPDVYGVGCIIGANEDMSSMITRTNDMLSNNENINILLWSETAVLCETDECGTGFDVDTLLTTAKQIAIDNSVFIGVTYLSYLDQKAPNEKNMFTLITPQGTVGFDYQKSHPVVLGIEPNVIPGKDDVLVYDGVVAGGTLDEIDRRIGGSICFDYDFPSYILQSSSKDADIMLQPSWTWGPLGKLHSQMDSARAAENGFTLLRCSSGGTSGVYDQKGIPLVLSENKFHDGGYVAHVPLPKRIFTLYGFMGDAVGYVAVAVAAILVVMASTRKVPSWLASDDDDKRGAFEEKNARGYGTGGGLFGNSEGRETDKLTAF
jgi:apolipoprotein N-acyltransferase